MNSRTIAILIFIFGALVLAVVFALIFLQNQDQPQQPPAEGEVTEGEEGAAVEEAGEPTATPSLIEVVVSLQTVPRGFQITQDNVDEIVTTDMRNPDNVATNVLISKDEAIGLYARTDIFQGETITRDALVRDPTVIATDEFGPSSLIPQGFIAMSVPVTEDSDNVEQLVNLVAQGIGQGDFVDVLITFDLYRIDPQFQTYLENDVFFFFEEFIEAQETVPTETDGNGENGDAEGSGNGDDDSGVDLQLFEVQPFGRFEELPTGDMALISPSEFQRPIHIGLVLQNAKVIQVGLYTPPDSPLAQIPTPTSEVPEGEATSEADATAVPTPVPPPPNVLVVALAPQQQLLLKHALEVGADIDFALRGAGDNQIFTIENVDLDLLLELFNIEIPPNFDYTLEVPGGADNGGGNGNGNGGSTPPDNDGAPEGGESSGQ